MPVIAQLELLNVLTTSAVNVISVPANSATRNKICC
jgi:hypothetical protein